MYSLLEVGPPAALLSFRHGALIVQVLAPATLPETVNIQVAGPAGNYCTLRSGGTAIAFSAGCADTITILKASSIKLVSTSGNVAADRTFEFLWDTVTNRS